jgi:hypothetical protein
VSDANSLQTAGKTAREIDEMFEGRVSSWRSAKFVGSERAAGVSSEIVA